MRFTPPEEIWIEESVADSPIAQRVRERAVSIMVSGPIPVREIPDNYQSHKAFSHEPAAARRAKRTLVLARHKGAFFKDCPCSCGTRHCGYSVLHYADNCSMGCTYCILQHTVNQPALAIYANVGDLARELEAAFRADPVRRLRIGTGEYADSLDMEPLTDYSADLVRAFARWPNATLELKTKTDRVDSLIGLDPGGAVVSWSLNPPAVVAAEERMTATLDERLAAASRVAAAGYRVAFHFDPMIHYAAWREDYAALVERVANAIPAGSIAWISIGALRFPASMKASIRGRYPDTAVLDGEFVPGEDGKMRYFKPIRLEMFRHMRDRLDSALPGVNYYLCMESEDVWRKVLNRAPDRDEILAETLSGSCGS